MKLSEVVSDEKTEEAMSKFVEECSAIVFKALDTAGIHYNDELLCLAMEDGFRAGASWLRAELSKGEEK